VTWQSARVAMGRASKRDGYMATAYRKRKLRNYRDLFASRGSDQYWSLVVEALERWEDNSLEHLRQVARVVHRWSDTLSQSEAMRRLMTSLGCALQRWNADMVLSRATALPSDRVHVA